MTPLSKEERLRSHANLDPAEISLAVQIRTEKIGFARFTLIVVPSGPLPPPRLSVVHMMGVSAKIAPRH